MKRLFFFLFISSLFFSIHAQESKPNFFEPATRNSRYLKFLLVPDSNTHAALVHCSYQYLYIPKSKSFYTGGMHFNIGLNVARFFSRKFILGVCIDLKSFKGFVKQKFSPSFVNDFNSNFITTYANGQDSARAYSLKEAINGTNGFGVTGNTFDGYGVSFSPFPDRFGGIMLQVKQDNFLLPFYGLYTKKIHLRDEGNELYFSLYKSRSFEISFNPYKFTSKKYVALNQFKKHIYKFLVVTLYYQRLNMTHSEFDDVPLEKMVNKAFIDKYKKVENFGVKVGLGVW